MKRIKLFEGYFDENYDDIAESIETILSNIELEGVMKNNKELALKMIKHGLEKFEDDCILFLADVMVRAKNGENVTEEVADHQECLNKMIDLVHEVIDAILDEY
jgi:hypothetical protein